MLKSKIKDYLPIISIYKGMVIAVTVTITIKTKVSDAKSQIRSMGTDKFVPTFGHVHNYQTQLCISRKLQKSFL